MKSQETPVVGHKWGEMSQPGFSSKMKKSDKIQEAETVLSATAKKKNTKTKSRSRKPADGTRTQTQINTPNLVTRVQKSESSLSSHPTPPEPVCNPSAASASAASSVVKKTRAKKLQPSHGQPLPSLTKTTALPKSSDTRAESANLLASIVSRLPAKDALDLLEFCNPAVIERGMIVCRPCFHNLIVFRLQSQCPEHPDSVPALIWPNRRVKPGCAGFASAWLEIRPRPKTVQAKFVLCDRKSCSGRSRSARLCTFPHSEEELSAWELDRRPPVKNIRHRPSNYRLSLCRHFVRFGECPYRKRCVYAHGPVELNHWSKNKRLHEADQSLAEVLGQKLQEALTMDNFSLVSSGDETSTVKISWEPEDRCAFIDASLLSPPYCVLFKCKITCEKKRFLKKVVLLPSTHSHFCVQCASQSFKDNGIQCSTEALDFTVEFTSQVSSAESFIQDVVIECNGLPFICQALHVDVTDGKTLKAIKHLRLTTRASDQHWEVDLDHYPVIPSPSVSETAKSRNLAKAFAIPNDSELSKEVIRLEILNKEEKLPRNKKYKRHFHTLIYLEEVELQSRLEQFSRKAISLMDDEESRFSGIKKIDLGCPLPPRVASSAYLRANDSPTVYAVSVADVQESVVGLNVSENFPLNKKLKNKGLLFDFRFRCDRNHWLSLHRALDRLPLSILKSHVHPDFQATTLKDVSPLVTRALLQVERFMNDDLLNNEQQRQAIGLILSNFASCHRLINGPFGTGKTSLLAEAVRLLTETRRKVAVLICTQSNYAADLYVKHLHQRRKQGFFNAKLIRISFEYRRVFLSDYLIREYFLRGDDGLFHAPSRGDLGERPLVVVTTLVTSRRLLDETRLPPGFFSHIIIDEAAQATEPESVIPLALADSETVLVLAGDCIQTSPPVCSAIARGGKFHRSLFRRLYKSMPKSLKVDLVTNYRSQADLFALIAKLFYNCGAVSPNQAQSPVQAVHPIFHPFSFFACNGTTQQSGVDGSFFNQKEAAAIVKQTVSVLDNWPKEWGPCSPSQICVVSSEHTQVQYIRQLLRNKDNRLKKVHVLSSRGIQGQEFHVVFVSTVFSSNGYRSDYEREPNFLSDKRILNTALTRAKCLAVVFGDPDCLIRCRIGETWKKYIEECHQVGWKSLLGEWSSSSYICELLMETTDLDVNVSPVVLRQSKEEEEQQCQQFVNDSEISGEELDSYAEGEREELLENSSSESSVYENSSDEESDDEMGRIYCREVVKNFVTAKALQRPGTDRKKTVKQVVEGSSISWKVVNVRQGRSANQEESETVRHSGRMPAYPPYKSSDQMKTLLKLQPDKYVKCSLKVTSQAEIAYGMRRDLEILVEGRYRRNRAFDGEEVLVELDANEEDDICQGRVVGIFQKRRPKRFLCQLLERKTDMFIPLDPSHPIIANAPSQNAWKYEGVCIFSMIDHQIEEVDWIPLSEVDDKLFVVEFIKWRPEFPYPVGIAVGWIDVGCFSGKEILKLQYDIAEDESDGGDDDDDINEADDDVRNGKENQENDGIVCNAFTIDPPHSRDLDDALSVDWDNETQVYNVGVYITDVSHHVPVFGDVDRQASERGLTVYDRLGFNKRSMLPKEIATGRCSLLPFKRRRVVAGRFSFNEDWQLTGEARIEECVIRSCCKLSYEQAQQIIDGGEPEIDCQGSTRRTVFRDVLCLSRIARCLRQRRLEEGRHYRDLDGSTEAEAHELVEEFMVLMNCEVARQLLSRRRNLTILSSQLRPSSDDTEEWLQLCRPFLNEESDQIVAHRDATGAGGESSYTDNDGTVAISKDIWRQIRSVLQSGGRLKDLVRLVCCEELVPQLSLCRSTYQRSLQRTLYTCSQTDEDFPTEHYQFRKFYTHFTSPIRRFVDLVMQRLIKRYVLDVDLTLPYDAEVIADICMNCNYLSRNIKKFNRQLELVSFSEEVLLYPIATVAVVEKIESNCIVLFVPECNSMPSRDRNIRLSAMDASAATVESDLRSLSMEWQIEMLAHPVKAKSQLVRIYPSLPQADFVAVSLESWKKIGEVVTSDKLNDSEKAAILKQLIETIESDQMNRSQETSSNNRSTSLARTVEAIAGRQSKLKEREPICKKIALFDLLSVQISSQLQRGILQLRIQLINFPDGLSICVDHNQRPGECFGPSLPRNAVVPRKYFSDLDEYLMYWSPVVAVESATASVNASSTATPTLIKELEVTWTKESGCFVGHAIINRNFAEEKKIAIKKDDYVCLRYFDLPLREKIRQKRDSPSDVWKLTSNLNKYHLVLHCYVSSSREIAPVERRPKKASEGSDDQVVHLEFQCSGGVSKEIALSQMEELSKMKERRCMVQTIHCSLPFRKMKQTLGLLGAGEEDNPLITEMVLGRLANKIRRPYDTPVGHRQLISLKEVLGCTSVLNESQYKAICRSLRQDITLIQGPPGTGKTVTGVHIAWHLAINNKKTHGGPKRQLFYCAPSNEAVDVVARKLKALVQKRGEKLSILRAYGASIVQAAFNGPWIFNRYAFAGLPRTLSRESEDLHDISLHRIIRDTEQSDDLKRNVAVDIVQREEKFKALFDSESDNIPTPDEVENYGKVVQQAEKQEIISADIILCTCIQASAKKYRDVKTDKTQCIVDEAGQCTEPETLVALFGTSGQIVLIGDHEQLQPVVQDFRVTEVLSKSMFERLSRKAYMLNIQYRMNQSICSFPSEHFYGGRLKTAEEVLSRVDIGLRLWPHCWRKLKLPVQHYQSKCFIHVEGEETITPVAETGKGGDESKSNQEEKNMIVHIIRFMKNKKQFADCSVRIITPYTAQREAIKNSLARLKKQNPFAKLTIGSIAETQGGEADFVILSTVRSLSKQRIIAFPGKSWRRAHLGFVADKHQINVALTRAKHGLIIVGNSHLLSVSDMWRELIRKYQEEKCLVADVATALQMFST